MLIVKLLSIICVAICFRHVLAKSNARDDEELSSCDNVSIQMDGLKASNKILELRLEVMDHHMQRHQQDVKEMIQKLQYQLVQQQNDNQNELKQLVESMRPPDQSEFFDNTEKPELLREFQKVSKVQEEILTKLVDIKYLSANDSISTKEEGAVNANGTDIAVTNCEGICMKILNEFGRNKTILNEQHDDNSEKLIAVANDLLHILNKTDNSKISVNSNDLKPLSTPVAFPTSCADYNPTHCAISKCRIKNPLYGSETFLVPCQYTSDEGGWTVIQRRINGAVDFYRNWSEYKMGFGNLDGEFWIGLDKLHALTASLAPVELLIQLKDHNDIMKYARYGKFSIGSEMEMYELKEADEYTGNAGDSLKESKGSKFSTKDKDNDGHSNLHCAVYSSGAWWYNRWSLSNLNGIYYNDGISPKLDQGIWWYTFHGAQYSMKFVQMMIKPIKAKKVE